MCERAPNIVEHFRQLWATNQVDLPNTGQIGTSKPFHFLTIGPRSEWHQAVAIIGHERHVFSVRSPLVLPNEPASTVQVRPYFEGSRSTAMERQPRFDGTGRQTIVDTEAPSAYLEVIAYDAVPSVWPFARPDMQYNNGNWTVASTEAVSFSCPVMGRRRLSVYFRADDETSTFYRFTGATVIDDSLHESEIKAVASATVGTYVSLHLDVDTDAYQWVRMYNRATAGFTHGEFGFIVRD